MNQANTIILKNHIQRDECLDSLFQSFQTNINILNNRIQNKRIISSSLPSFQGILIQKNIPDFQQRLDIDEMVLRIPDQQSKIKQFHNSQIELNQKNDLKLYTYKNVSNNKNAKKITRLSSYQNSVTKKIDAQTLFKQKTLQNSDIIEKSSNKKNSTKFSIHKKNHSAKSIQEQKSKIFISYNNSDDNEISSTKKSINISRSLIFHKTPTSQIQAKQSSYSSIKINDSLTTNHDIQNLAENHKNKQQSLNKFEQLDIALKKTQQKYKIKSDNIFKNFQLKKIDRYDDLRQSDSFLKYQQYCENQNTHQKEQEVNLQQKQKFQQSLIQQQQQSQSKIHDNITPLQLQQSSIIFDNNISQQQQQIVHNKTNTQLKQQLIKNNQQLQQTFINVNLQKQQQYEQQLQQQSIIYGDHKQQQQIQQLQQSIIQSVQQKQCQKQQQQKQSIIDDDNNKQQQIQLQQSSIIHSKQKCQQYQEIIHNQQINQMNFNQLKFEKNCMHDQRINQFKQGQEYKKDSDVQDKNIDKGYQYCDNTQQKFQLDEYITYDLSSNNIKNQQIQRSDYEDIEQSIQYNQYYDSNMKMNSPVVSEIKKVDTDSSFFTQDQIEKTQIIRRNSFKVENTIDLLSQIQIEAAKVKRKSLQIFKTKVKKNLLLDNFLNELQLQKYNVKDKNFFKVIVQDYDTSQTKFERQISIKIKQYVDVEQEFNFSQKQLNIDWNHQNYSQNQNQSKNFKNDEQAFKTIKLSIKNINKSFQNSPTNFFSDVQNSITSYLQYYNSFLDLQQNQRNKQIQCCFENQQKIDYKYQYLSNSFIKQYHKQFHQPIKTINFKSNYNLRIKKKNSVNNNSHQFQDFPNLIKRFQFFQRSLQYQVKIYDRWIGKYKISIETPFNILQCMITHYIYPSCKNEMDILSSYKFNNQQKLLYHKQFDNNIKKNLNDGQQEFQLDYVISDNSNQNVDKSNKIVFDYDKILNSINLNMIKQFEEQLKDVQFLNKQIGDQKNTLLIYAVAKGNFEITKQILKLNPNLEIKNIHGNTALLISSFYQNKEILNYLIQSGADQTATNYLKENIQSIWQCTDKNKYKIIFHQSQNLFV